MSQIETVTLGEEASVVADCDAVLYASAKEVVWSNALAISDVGSLMLKLTAVDMDYIRRLRIRSRVALMSLAGARAGDSQITGPELFWMCVNNFLFSEASREFRLPMGSEPIHRTNSRGRIMCRTGAVPDRCHPNAFVNSLMLCLLNVCSVAHCVGWVPIYVNYSPATAAMRLIRVSIIRARNQTLISGIIYIENVKVIPTFRINFLNFPWQLLGASGPAGFTCLSCIVTQFI